MRGRDTTEVHASDLTLDTFVDAATLTAALTQRCDAGGPADRGDRFPRALPGPGMPAMD